MSHLWHYKEPLNNPAHVINTEPSDKTGHCRLSAPLSIAPNVPLSKAPIVSADCVLVTINLNRLHERRDLQTTTKAERGPTPTFLAARSIVISLMIPVATTHVAIHPFLSGCASGRKNGNTSMAVLVIRMELVYRSDVITRGFTADRT